MKIRFRIVDDLEELKIISRDEFDKENFKISGFFEICFGNHKEGCYFHENPLQIGETGGELLDYWFGVLLDVVILMKEEKKCYVAIKEIETTKKWIEMKRDKNNIIINVAIDDENKLTDLLITNQYDGFSYMEPKNEVVEFEKLETEVIENTEDFLKELKCLNPELIQTRMAKKLDQKLKRIRNSNKCHWI